MSQDNFRSFSEESVANRYYSYFQEYPKRYYREPKLITDNKIYKTPPVKLQELSFENKLKHVTKKRSDNFNFPNSVVNALNYKLIQKPPRKDYTSFISHQCRPQSASASTQDAFKNSSQASLKEKVKKEKNQISTQNYSPTERKGNFEAVINTTRNRNVKNYERKSVKDFKIETMQKKLLFQLLSSQEINSISTRDQATEIDEHVKNTNCKGFQKNKRCAVKVASTNTDFDGTKIDNMIYDACNYLDEEITRKRRSSLDNFNLLNYDSIGNKLQMNILQDRIEQYIKVCIPDICNNVVIKKLQDKINAVESLILSKSDTVAIQLQKVTKGTTTQDDLQLYVPTNKISKEVVFKPNDQKINTYQKNYCSQFCNDNVITDLQNKIDILEKNCPHLIKKTSPNVNLNYTIKKIENPFLTKEIEHKMLSVNMSGDKISLNEEIEGNYRKRSKNQKAEKPFKRENVIDSARQVLHDAEELLGIPDTPRVRSTSEVQEAYKRGNLERYYDRYKGTFVTKPVASKTRAEISTRFQSRGERIKSSYTSLTKRRPRTAPVISNDNDQHTRFEFSSNGKETIKRICKRIDNIEHTSYNFRKTIDSLKMKVLMNSNNYFCKGSDFATENEEYKKLQELESRLIKYAANFEKKIENCKKSLAKIQDQSNINVAIDNKNDLASVKTASNLEVPEITIPSHIPVSANRSVCSRGLFKCTNSRFNRPKCVRRNLRKCSNKSIRNLKVGYIDKKIKKLQSYIEEYENIYLNCNEATINLMEQKLNNLKKKYHSSSCTTDGVEYNINVLENVKKKHRSEKKVSKKLKKSRSISLKKSTSDMVTADGVFEKLDRMHKQYSNKVNTEKDHINTSQRINDCEIKNYFVVPVDEYSCESLGITNSHKTLVNSFLKDATSLPDYYSENILNYIPPSTHCIAATRLNPNSESLLDWNNYL